MSEKRYKRFYVSKSENQLTIYDNEGLDDYYHLGNDERDVKGICKLLNEQQSTIDKLRVDIRATRTTIRKLQDLCGKSDGENAKLRIENKMLEKEVNLLKPTNIEQYEQIQKLQEENEQLQAQLREKEQEERLYANEILELREANKEWLQFKSLGGDY